MPRLSVKRLALETGGHTILDEADFKYYSKWKWYRDSTGYAKRVIYVGGGRKNQKSKSFHLHREIMKTPVELETDHINRNKLDNRKENLRIVTRQQNACNRALQQNNTSGYRGVTWNKDRGKWMAQIKAYGQHYYLGLFNDKIEAAKAYNKAAKKHFNNFAELNDQT